MSAKDNLELQASALANLDAISAIIAVLANTGALNPLLFKEALSAIKDLNESTEGDIHSHQVYKAHMQIFIAAAEKRL
ncbi:hypothetical protein [Pseudomonas coronafaciens]|uniref:Uncharacterized protein n=1 Tax=Pseudomonas coronafaciens pv. coronafaciens TaxID=235275 RepID=A0AAE6UMD6_9PSED|nr:hypothetical protein [Pseudomonas coronafaciens]QGT82919.1 hypothetical protein GMO17_17945 [Pseudomonas coronafaciens pv. coronafaciens]